MIRAVLLSLFYASLAAAQNPPGYNTAFFAAKERGVPLVIFVACDGRDIVGAETLEVRRFPEAAGPQIVVGNPQTLKCHRLPPTATDAEIAAYFPVKSSPRLLVATTPTYSTPVYVQSHAPNYSQQYSTPYYGNCANGQCGPQASYGYQQPVYSVPYYSSGVGVSAGFQLGPIGAYGGFGAGNCANGQCR